MLSVQPPSTRSVPSSVSRELGQADRTLVWALTVACVVLILPILFLEDARSTRSAKDDAWLEFAGPEYLVIQFNEAPVLSIPLGLTRAWSPEQDDLATLSADAKPDEPAPPPLPAYFPFRWLDDQTPPLRSAIDPRRFQYKLDPSFSFENRDLRVNGMMFRMHVEF